MQTPRSVALSLRVFYGVGRAEAVAVVVPSLAEFLVGVCWRIEVMAVRMLIGIILILL